jgi:predicted nuclease with TOPRIM domain
MRSGGDGAPFRSLDPEGERQALRKRASALEAELDRVRGRLDEMEKENP